ncbi:FAD-binding oxidoreductase [Paraglaciecola sp. Hal342]
MCRRGQCSGICLLYSSTLSIKRPFTVVDCHKGSADDWYLTIKKDADFQFEFDAGQFVWINTSGSAFKRNEHPFSIASSPRSLPELSFVIRNLGDYTNQLGKLKTGQRVWVDGPHGVFTLNARNAQGIVLLAGGAGIGPIIGILRDLKERADSRPVRLIYGNRNMTQMMFLDELADMAKSINLVTTLVLNDAPDNFPPAGFKGHEGFMSKSVIEEAGEGFNTQNWDYYICGPQPMVKAVEASLQHLDIPQSRILYEQLGF